MPSRFIRFILSLAVVLQLAIVCASLLSHRGTSRIQDDFLTFFDVYRTFGNWRMESNTIAIAASNELSESIWIEWHVTGAAETEWIAWPDQNRTPRLGTLVPRQQKWLRQLADLNGLGVTEGVSQMVATATRARFHSNDQSIDQVRVMASPAVSIDRFIELESAVSLDDLPEDLRPHSIFEARVFDLGNGQRTLLPKIENRRLSPSVKNESGTHSIENAKVLAPKSQADGAETP